MAKCSCDPMLLCLYPETSLPGCTLTSLSTYLSSPVDFGFFKLKELPVLVAQAGRTTSAYHWGLISGTIFKKRQRKYLLVSDFHNLAYSWIHKSASMYLEWKNHKKWNSNKLVTSISFVKKKSVVPFYHSSFHLESLSIKCQDEF
jgi:hypothetical protein